MKLGHLLGICGMVCSEAVALGGVPSNDTCSNPQAIGPGAHLFDTTDATFSGTAASCDYSEGSGADLWYLYTAQLTGIGEVGNYLNTDCSTAMYIQVSLMSGTGCGGTELACQDDICYYSGMRLHITQGSTYLLRITTYGKGPGSFTINEHLAPANDKCETATAVGPGNDVATWDDQWASTNTPFPSCGVGNNPDQLDVWYSYTAASTGNAAVDIDINRGTTISVFDGSCAGPQIPCGAGQPGQNWAGFPVTAGHKYLVRLGRPLADYFEFSGTVNIHEYPAPANDTCAQAQAMTALPITSTQTTYNYDNSGALDNTATETWSDCGQVNGSIWYKFTASQAGVAILSATSNWGGNQYVNISTYSSCNSASITACGAGFVNIPVTAGQTILVRVGQVTVDGNSNFYRTGTLTASIVQPVPGDSCATAIAASEGTIVLNNLDALNNASPPNSPTCFHDPGALTHDLWFSWSSPNPGTLLVNTCGIQIGDQIYDTTLAIYNGCSGSPIACDDDSGYFGAINIFADSGNSCTDYQSSIELPVAANTVYKIRLAGYPWGQGRLNIAFSRNNNNFLSAASIVHPVSGGQPTAIDGVLSTSTEVDVYRVHICDINAFSAHTDNSGTMCDTQLFLFDSHGYGIAANNNAVQGIQGSALSDQYITEEGDYYLAVVGGGSYGSSTIARQPISSGGLIWSGSFPDSETDPDGPGAASSVTGWIGYNHVSLSPNYPANYHLVLEGICTSCPADFNGDSVRDVADLFGYINAWLAKTPNANFNGDNAVDVADLFGFINAWLAGC